MKKFNVLLFLLFISAIIFAQKFEGIVKIAKETTSDTSYYTYYVKGNQIRIDEQGWGKETISYSIFNRTQNCITKVFPMKKNYEKITVRRHILTPDKSIAISKTPNTKTIAGHTCQQWILKDKSKDLLLIFWIADGYSFFYELMQIADFPDLIYQYYLKIENISTVFPFVIEESSFLKQFRSRIVVKEFTKMKLDDNIFKVPQEFTSK